MEGEGVLADPDSAPPCQSPTPQEPFGGMVSRLGGFEALMGGFGRHQRLVCVLTWLPLPPLAFALLSGSFLTLVPAHRCRREGEGEGEAAEGEGSCQLNTSDHRPCPYGWKYQSSEGLNTNIITQWDLVCDSSWKSSVEEICFVLGCLAGFLVLGYLADRLGRRICCLLSVSLSILFGTLLSVAPSLPVFTLARFFQGSAVAGLLLSLYLIRLEVCDPPHRLPVSMVSGLFLVGGEFLLLGLAVGCRDWRLFQGVITAPLGLFLGFCCPQVLPEPLRWLLSTGRVPEARAALGRILERNQPREDREPLELESSFTDLDSSYPGNHESERETLCKLLKCRNIWKNILILGFTAFIGHGIQHCYGTFRNSVLGTRPSFSVMYLLSAGAGGLACLFLCATVDRCGRRGILLLSMTLTGLASLILLGLSEYLNDVTILIFCSLGLFSSRAVETLSILFSSEVIPTLIRGLGLGVVLGLSWLPRLSRLLLELQGSRAYFLHHVLLASLALLGCLCILLLPETKRKPLPDSLQQGELCRRPSFLQRPRDNVPLLAAPNPTI
ncbi:solute carrier family 22 member 17 [Mobula birostris]|uniref:solute carrier family 22 member 17 n=1 Tax=Mobula birostris TaxID=1983395 RepID=UPI003B286660